MLHPAQLYKEELQRKLISCWYEEKYQWYFGESSFTYELANNNDFKHEFVHLDKDGHVDGFFSYSHDGSAKSLRNFGLISFSDWNVDFLKDVLQRIDYMFRVEGYRRLDFWCFADNPIRKTYEKIILRNGGTLAGTLHESTFFKGKYHDMVFYELLARNYDYTLD